MTDSQQYFYTPNSSMDGDAYNRSFDSAGSGSYSYSTDSYTQRSHVVQRSPSGTVLRHRVNLPSDYYAQNLDRDTEYKKSITTRKVIQRIDFFPKVDRYVCLDKRLHTHDRQRAS